MVWLLIPIPGTVGICSLAWRDIRSSTFPCPPACFRSRTRFRLRPVQDIVERFQLLLVLCFVVVEDISNSGTWWPAAGTLLECGRIFVWEVRATGLRIKPLLLYHSRGHVLLLHCCWLHVRVGCGGLWLYAGTGNGAFWLLLLSRWPVYLVSLFQQHHASPSVCNQLRVLLQPCLCCAVLVRRL